MRIRILPNMDDPPGHQHTHDVEILDDGKEELTVTTRQEYGPFGVPPTNQPNEINPEDLRGYDPQRRSTRDDVVTEAWPANVKRTYDEYQDHSIADRHLNHAHISRLQLAAEQAIQNMISNQHAMTQNMISQTNAINQQVARGMSMGVGYDALGHAQAYAHRDIAVNKEWNNPYNYQAFRAADEHVPGQHGVGHSTFVDPSSS